VLVSCKADNKSYYNDDIDYHDNSWRDIHGDILREKAFVRG